MLVVWDLGAGWKDELARLDDELARLGNPGKKFLENSGWIGQIPWSGRFISTGS